MLTWIGHARFKIESQGYTLILDPYEDGYVPGLKPLKERANMVLCSHEHGDHNAKDLVEITEGKDCPFTITTIDTFLRGRVVRNVVRKGAHDKLDILEHPLDDSGENKLNSYKYLPCKLI